MHMSKCIWCKKTNQPPSVEHIIPEVVGCPDGFVLNNGEVCRPCNNRLGHADRAIAHEFDFVLHHFNVPRKRGKPPEIRSRGNVVATSAPREISFNMVQRPPLPMMVLGWDRLGVPTVTWLHLSRSKAISLTFPIA